MPGDPVIAFQRVSQNLGRAYNAHQGSSFLRYFAAKLMPELSPEQKAFRLQLLRMGGQLVDTEFEEAMDLLVASWKEYKEAK